MNEFENVMRGRCDTEKAFREGVVMETAPFLYVHSHKTATYMSEVVLFIFHDFGNTFIISNFAVREWEEAVWKKSFVFHHMNKSSVSK